MGCVITKEEEPQVKPHDDKRSSKWPTVRKHYLENNPACAVCGGCIKLEVHHVRPFHLHPGLELDPLNLITLCESGRHGINCHLFIGHLGSYKSYNVSVKQDAYKWHDRMKSRP